MSVINKMLRDLDSRQAAGAVTTQVPAPRAGLAHGTQVISTSGRWGLRVSLSRLSVLLTGLLVVAAIAAVGWWYLNTKERGPSVDANALDAPVVSKDAAVLANRVGTNVPGAGPVVEPVKAEAVSSPVAPKPVAELGRIGRTAIALKMENLLREAPHIETPTKPIAVATPRVVPERLPQDRPPKERVVESAPLVHPPIAPSTTSNPSISARPSPALEAVAQAQSLWNAGSRDTAIELAREALALAERANAAGAPTGSPAVLGSLARELARMELAEGHVGQALEMLTRLEPALSGSADVWALRGNAAQRLGRHQESAAAYLMALKLRPDEPRWMLGAAVSLAAQGQTASAAELAEKARAGGVLSREVAAYLRQLGVPLRER